MDVELISIGDEIITGHTVDTNTPYIARRLAEIGLSVVYRTAVGDDLTRMEEVILQALKRTDVVIATGGLGPTDDDITKKGIVKVFKRNLVFHEDVLDDLKQRFAARGIEMPAINQNQALLPQGAVYLPNRIGSAVGIVIVEGGKVFASLPGVPREMEVITDEELIPYLQTHLVKQGHLKIHKLRTTGIFESALAEKIAPYIKLPENVRLAYLPSFSGVDLRVIASGGTREMADEAGDKIVAQLRQLTGKYIYGEGEDTLESVVGKLLTERSETVSTAESCTAGLLAGKITDIPGSSKYFLQGEVTYSNRSKIDFLGVPAETIEKFGAVSGEVAEAMAAGILQKAGTDYGIAITGIAGPDGGTDEKPIGTVFIAVASKKGVASKKFMMSRDRQSNRGRSVYAALEMLRRTILEIE
ncbi:MAG: competence/damage-inducible protein A [candidate division Zixibacteria bacterium HGW-Zixibacteria-1]|nr:MAG: competence/damage-inducible protein A [candidate division Zixibacteria bacterium HGW-Zixibacteria-1]